MACTAGSYYNPQLQVCATQNLQQGEHLLCSFKAPTVMQRNSPSNIIGPVFIFLSLNFENISERQKTYTVRHQNVHEFYDIEAFFVHAALVPTSSHKDY